MRRSNPNGLKTLAEGLLKHEPLAAEEVNKLLHISDKDVETA